MTRFRLDREVAFETTHEIPSVEHADKAGGFPSWDMSPRVSAQHHGFLGVGILSSLLPVRAGVR